MLKAVGEGLSFVKKTIVALLLLILILVAISTLPHFRLGVGIYVELGFVILWALIIAFIWHQQTFTIGKASLTKNTATILVIIVFLASSTIFGFIRFYQPRKVVVGVTYQIEDAEDLNRLIADGITSVRISYEAGIVYPSTSGIGNDRYYTLVNFFKKAKELGIDIILQTPVYSTPEFEKYVSEFGLFIDYYQLANELDTVHKLVGAPYMFMETEIITILENLKAAIGKHDADFKTIVTWSTAFTARIDLVSLGGLGRICEHADIVGYDVYQGEGATLLPYAVNLLRSLTKKQIWITEVGMSTKDQKEQADYIVQTLDFAKRNDIERVYIFTWNIDWNEYAIKGKLAEKEVMEWIEENANLP